MRSKLQPFSRPPVSAFSSLYQRALAAQWTADEVLDWQKLAFNRLPAGLRQAMATVYSDVCFAEEFGLGLTARMVDLAGEGLLRDFARLQTRDEARHVAFFSRVLMVLEAEAEQSSELWELRTELDCVGDYYELVLHTQVIEIAAQVVFTTFALRSLELMRGSIRVPGSESVMALLQAVVKLVGADESRHIAFGSRCIQSHLATAGVISRHRFEQQARASARLVYQAFERRSNEFARLGWAPSDVLDRAWRSLYLQLGRLELDIGGAELCGTSRSD